MSPVTNEEQLEVETRQPAHSTIFNILIFEYASSTCVCGPTFLLGLLSPEQTQGFLYLMAMHQRGDITWDYFGTSGLLDTFYSI